MTTRKHEFDEEMQHMEPPEEEKTPEIWTPPKTIDVNTRGYAWLLFLKWWDRSLQNKAGMSGLTGDIVTSAYKVCLTAAQAVRELEQGEG